MPRSKSKRKTKSAVGSSEMVRCLLGSVLFTFSSFGDWCDTAKRKFKRAGITSQDAVCIDTKGRPCAWGAHFIAARDEKAYPVTVYALRPGLEEASNKLSHGPEHEKGTK